MKLKKQRSSNLTSRELEILKLIADEFTNFEIANTLEISQHTVITHRRNLMNKLDARNTAGLVRAALAIGVVY